MSCIDCDPINLVIHPEPTKDPVDLVIEKPTEDLLFLNSDYLIAGPPAPKLLLVSEILSDSSIALDWEDLSNSYSNLNTNHDSYTVYVKHVESNTLVQTITGIQLSEADVFGLNNLEEYEFWVTAVRGEGESYESNHVFGTPEKQQPDAPQNFNVEVVTISPTSSLIRVLYEKNGVDGEIYESPIESYSSSLWETTGLSNSYNIRDIHIDCVHRKVVVSANGSWPSILSAELDSPAGFGSLFTSGWNSGMGVDEVEGYVYACNTYERIYKVDYDGTSVDSYSLFSSRRGRPSACEIDSGAQCLIVNVGNETSRLLTFDLSDQPVEDKEVEIETEGGTSIITIEKSRGRVLYREIGDSTSIRWSNYDSTENERLYTHDESIRWIRCLPNKPDWLYFSTATGLYALHIEMKEVVHILETDEIGKFDLEYEV